MGHATMLDLFRASVRRAPSAERADLDAASDAFAAALLDRAFLFGDRLAIALPDGPELLIALVGTWKAGGAAVLVDPATSTAALTGVLARSGATALLAEGEHDAVVASSRTAVHIVIAGTGHLRDLIALHAGERPLASAPGPDDLAVRVGSDDYSHRAMVSAAREDTTTPVGRLGLALLGPMGAKGTSQ